MSDNKEENSVQEILTFEQQEKQVIEQFNKELNELMKFNYENSIKYDQRISSQAVRKYAEYNDYQVEEFLRDPRNHSKELRHVARDLFNRSPHFSGVVSYYPNVAIHSPLLKATKRKMSKKKYDEGVDYVNKLSLSDELNKVYATCFLEDIFFGIEFETEYSYTIHQLDPDYCRISSIEHGAYNFELDFSIFQKSKNADCKVTLLENCELMIPGFFKKNFEEYKKNGYKTRWVELPPDKSICIKLMKHLDYPFPPFISVYQDVDDIQDYKKLTKVSEEQNNYKLLAMKIPLHTTNKAEKSDHFAVKLSTAKQFYEMSRGNIDDSFGLVMTPFDIQEMSFTNSKTNAQSRVNEATNQLYDSVGISRIIFNSENSNAIKYSILQNDAMIFKLNDQVSRWLTRKLYYKFNEKGKGVFELKLLNVTQNNKDDEIDRLLKLAQYGHPVNLAISAIVGTGQLGLETMCYVENKLLDLQNMLIPLSSSHTQTSDSTTGTVGREKVADEDLSESGQVTRELGSNNERGGSYQFIEGGE